MMSGLHGKRIVITRARHQAAPLHGLLMERGAIPVSYPCIAIEPPADTSILDAQLTALASYDYVLLTSANAVAAVASRLRELKLSPDWTRTTIAVIGTTTKAALHSQLSLPADIMPADATGEALMASLPNARGSRVLLPQSDLAGDFAIDILRGRGAEVTEVIAYRTVIGSGGDDVPSLIAAGKIDAITFVSPSATRYFTMRCPLSAAKDLPTACLGPVTERNVRELGFRIVIAPEKTGLAPMLEALEAHFASPSHSA